MMSRRHKSSLENKRPWLWGLFLALLWIFLEVSRVAAFFMVVIPEKGDYAVAGEEVRWLLFRGEPFQGLVRDLFPPKVFMRLPDGKQAPVALTVISLKDLSTGKERRAYRPKYIPTQPGDYYLCLISKETFVPKIGEVWQEFTKVPLHVEREKAWDKPVGLKVEIVPLTRPYGLETGAVFRGQVLFEGKPVKKALVQITRYHGVFVPSEDLPHDPNGKLDQPRMYQVVRADEEGYFVVGLNQPGWWLLSARIPHGYTILAQQRFPLILRASFWLRFQPPFRLEGTCPRLEPSASGSKP